MMLLISIRIRNLLGKVEDRNTGYADCSQTYNYKIGKDLFPAIKPEQSMNQSPKIQIGEFA